jgi:hypothetical protein
VTALTSVDFSRTTQPLAGSGPRPLVSVVM